MNWTSDYGTQRPCQKGLGASGPKGLKPMYYSILRGYFITVAFQLCFWIWHLEGLSTPGGTEIVWDILASGHCLWY